MATDDPKPGAYAPYAAARHPTGEPERKPRFRLLVHHKFMDEWNAIIERVGETNAREFWDHVTERPGEPPKVGRATVMKGAHNKAKWPGYSKTIHYEISGAGRIDYQYNSQSTEGEHGDSHGVVKILAIDFDSH